MKILIGTNNEAKVKKYGTILNELGIEHTTFSNVAPDPTLECAMEGAKVANEVTLQYSYYHTTSYKYDEANKVYKRYMSDKANIDLETDEQYTAKNIIVYKVNNYTISGDDKGRQELDNIGSGSGYYITNGYSIPITWEKTSHSGQTVYKNKNGEKLVVNDGNTFIQICPTGSEISITE